MRNKMEEKGKNMFKIMKKIVNILICNLMYHVKYENIEQLNIYERCLICPNHTSIFDPFYIFTKTDDLHIMAKSEIFKNLLFSKVLKYYNVFPIKRGKSDVGGVRHVINLFENNKKIKLLMFPEGGILKGSLRKNKIRNGAVHMAAVLNVPIIPVSITENPKIFHKVVVTVKEPIFPKEEVLQDKEKLQEISKQLLKIIYEM